MYSMNTMSYEVVGLPSSIYRILPQLSKQVYKRKCVLLATLYAKAWKLLACAGAIVKTITSLPSGQIFS